MSAPQRKMPSQPPTIEEQITVIEENIDSLLESNWQDGQIADPQIRRDIECLQATRRLLISSLSQD